MATGSFRTELQAILRDIIEGKIVKRSKYELRWETRDLSLEFIEALQDAGYTQIIVQSVELQPGERVPAFSIRKLFIDWSETPRDDRQSQ